MTLTKLHTRHIHKTRYLVRHEMRGRDTPRRRTKRDTRHGLAQQCGGSGVQFTAVQRNAIQSSCFTEIRTDVAQVARSPTQLLPGHYKTTRLQDHAMRGRRGEGAGSSKIRATKQIQAKDQTFPKHHTRHIHKTRRRAGGLCILPAVWS